MEWEGEMARYSIIIIVIVLNNVLPMMLSLPCTLFVYAECCNVRKSHSKHGDSMAMIAHGRLHRLTIPSRVCFNS